MFFLEIDIVVDISVDKRDVQTNKNKRDKISLPYGLMKVCASCVLFSELVPVWAPLAECNRRSTSRPDQADGRWRGDKVAHRPYWDIIILVLWSARHLPNATDAVGVGL